MALRACIWNVHDMEPEALQWLGWSYASPIYNHLKSTDTLTFHAWSLFRKAYPEEIDQHTIFRVQERGLESIQYPSLIDRLSKLDVGMLTFLCIMTPRLSISHLVALTKIQGLAVLVLEDGSVGYRLEKERPLVDTIRSWGRSIAESSVLSKLRVFVLSGYHGIESSVVLKSVSSLLSLNLVGINGPYTPPEIKDCGGDWQDDRLQRLTFDGTTPAAIWESAATTRASTMQQLYDFSLGISRTNPTKESAYQSVSMTYSQSQAPVAVSSTYWFYRELRDGPDPRIKRSQSISQSEQTDNHGKKRKIRNEKKVGVDALLGSFM
ncbi:hypothetical protein ACJQWK_02385 [Exserohilum turcicum]